MGASFFLILNGIILFVLLSRIVSFALSRGRPTLNDQNSQKPANNFKVEFFDVLSRTDSSPREKSLNCLFEFDGITRDAYEVLGVPAGAPKDVCQGAYRDLSRTGKGDTKRLLDSAIKALGFS